MQHMMTHSDARQCQHCSLNFPNAANLKQHKKIHHERNIKRKGPSSIDGRHCEKCPAVFKTVHCLKVHDSMMHSLDPSSKKVYPCNICPAFYATFQELQNHAKNECSSLFQCDVCGINYSNKSALFKHMQVHQPYDSYTMKQLQCEHCFLQFTDTVSWQDHLLTNHSYHSYSKGTTFPCRHCSAIFGKESQWMRHEMTHLGS